MPQNPDIIATKSPSNDVFIFDRTKHSTAPAKDDKPAPNLRLTGHTDGGYALAWNLVNSGHVASGSDDCAVKLWDVEGAPGSDGGIPALSSLAGHTKAVQGLSYHSEEGHTLASVGDDGNLIIWDTRSGTAVHTVKAHDNEVNSVAFNPNDPNIIATGSSDKTAGMWDLRNMTEKLHSFAMHTAEVYSVEWAPFSGNILSTCGSDRRVCIWDISAIGQEQDEEDAEDGPPELMFTHAGHTEKVHEAAWCPGTEWLMGSVADDEVLMVWQLAKALREEEDDEEEEDEDDLE
jgi:WD40 repeat protein